MACLASALVSVAGAAWQPSAAASRMERVWPGRIAHLRWGRATTIPALPPRRKRRSLEGATAAHAGAGAAAIRSGHGGGVHAGRRADPAPGMEGGVLRLPGTARRGLCRAALRKVLPRRVRLSSTEGERRAR